MAVDPLISQSDLERRFTPATVLRFADDAGVGDPSDAGVSSIVSGAIQEASAIAQGLLRNSWTTEQVVILAQEDPSVAGAVADIAIALLARRRPEFLSSDGTTLYSGTRREAERVLKAMADRDISPPGDTAAGPNKTIGTYPNRPATSLIFQGSSGNNRGPGGF